MSASVKTKGAARVRFTLDIPLDDSWGGECSVDQVFRQAKEAVNYVIRGVVEIPSIHEGCPSRKTTKLAQLLERGEAHFFEEPKVVAVFVEEQR